MTIFFDPASNLHPYECGANCPHCDRRVSADHDPATCALCDPEYDLQPNPYWRTAPMPPTSHAGEDVPR